MRGFTDISTLISGTPSQSRLTQQDLVPGAVKSRFLSSNFIQTTATTTSGATSLASGSSLVIQSIVASDANPNIPIGSVPFSIVFFQGSLNTSNMIGVTITGSGYSIKGPISIPSFTPHASNGTSTIYGGSDGNNLVFVTELFNNTGSTQTIYYITNTRYIQGAGGVAG